MSYPYAKFTMTWLEFRANDITFVTKFFNNVDEKYRDLVVKEFNGIWDFNEISGETILEEERFLDSDFAVYYDEFLEQITNYNKSFNYEDAIKRKVTSETIGTANSTTENKELYSDLPNKKLDASDFFNYPTSTTKNNGTGSNTTDETSTRTEENNALYISMKNAYIRQIHDYVRDFCYKFSNCFLHIFE